MERPEFNEIQDYDEFCKYYWYREELIKHFCADDSTKIFDERLKAAASLLLSFAGVLLVWKKGSKG